MNAPQTLAERVATSYATCEPHSEECPECGHNPASEARVTEIGHAYAQFQRYRIEMLKERVAELERLVAKREAQIRVLQYLLGDE